MRPAIRVIFVLYCAASFSQDLKVKEEAVCLLEQANAASSPPSLRISERVDTLPGLRRIGRERGSSIRVVRVGADGRIYEPVV